MIDKTRLSKTLQKIYFVFSQKVVTIGFQTVYLRHTKLMYYQLSCLAWIGLLDFDDLLKQYFISPENKNKHCES